jgi:hypothetical protein
MTSSIQTLHDTIVALITTAGIAVALSLAIVAAAAFVERGKARARARAVAGAPVPAIAAQHPTQADATREPVLR